ncbi:hypothetical protein TNCV_2891511 [Trichonephila clavipes]|nr:hypothetical protein TNCV_2891511 [Trichonephila clavipes]
MKEQRGVAQFLAVEGVGGHEMLRQMKAVYGEYSLSHSSVVEWRKRFLEGQCGEDDIAAVSVGNSGTSTVHTYHPMIFMCLDL